MKNITGQKFGKLTAVRFNYRKGTKYFWIFNCELCGKDKNMERYNVTSGLSQSCGCRRQKGINNSRYVHGMRQTRFSNIWRVMKQRCFNKNNPAYKWYGARGIKVCDRWNNFENFRDDMYQSYLEHVKEFGEKLTEIDRINNDGNYCKDNCRWATRKEQNNNKRNNIH